MTTFDNLDQELSLEEIQQVEEELQVKFPQVLIDHYLKWNGGFPDHCIFQHDDESNQVCIEQCLPLKTDNKNHTTAPAAYRNLQKREVPAQYFPFGIDPCGAYFILDLTDPTHAIYFYQTDITPPKLEACLRPLDAGFEDFWPRLGSDID